MITTFFNSASAASSLFERTRQGSLLFGLPIVGFQLSQARRGEMVGETASAAFSILSTPLIAAGIGAVVAVAVPGVGTVFGADLIIGSLAGLMAEMPTTHIRKAVRCFSELDLEQRRLNMGGSYQDTQYAQRQRMQAVQNMNSAMVPSRRYLGQEARLFHR